MTRSSWVVSTLLTIAQVPLGISSPNCPYIGPEFPPPRDLASHPAWKAAIANISKGYDSLDTLTDQWSYSVQIFSTNPGPPILWERYLTGKNIPSNTTGVKKVDGDTVYRLGSISKAYTILAWLAEIGDEHWNQPITKYIPELVSNSTFDSVRRTAFEDITIGALASQISGLGRDYGTLGELTETDWGDNPTPDYTWFGFPPVNSSDLPPCGAWPLCDRQQFLRALNDIMYPSFPAWQTAGYSNINYQLLAYALEKITGKDFVDILNDRVLNPLGLNRTYYYPPPDSVGVIPGSMEDTYWNVYLGEASPSGNMYSSANDLSTLGRGILTSQLLKPALTRRWLNPVSFASDVLASVGAPWGVRRIQLDKENQPHRTISVLTKAGSFKVYTAFITIIRDWGIGFTIMMAGQTGYSNFAQADLIGASLLPAYQTVVRDEANKIYGGRYSSIAVAANGTLINSTLTITVSDTKPGLGLENFISNGTDMTNMAIELALGQFYNPVKPEARLYYTTLEANTTDGGKRQAFKAVFEELSGPALGQPMWSTDCGSWVGQTAVTYDSLPLDQFIFYLNKNGDVVSVENLALQMMLYKEGGPGPTNGTKKAGKWVVPAPKKGPRPNIGKFRSAVEFS